MISLPTNTVESPIAYEIDLGIFSGPMDLLLHLVHQEELSIEDVELSRVAERFLEVIRSARYLDLDEAAEYLVIAATLMSIKSATLLPEGNPLGEGEFPEGESSAFYEELRERLRQYELTKLRAQELRARPQLGLDTFSRPSSLRQIAEQCKNEGERSKTDDVEPEFTICSDDLGRLGAFFGNLLRRVGAGLHALRIRVEPISIVHYMMRVVDTLQEHFESFGKIQSRGVMKFGDLVGRFAISSGEKKSAAVETDSGSRIGVVEHMASRHRAIVIGSFMAILELVRRGLVSVEQSTAEEDIALRFNENGNKTQISNEGFEETLLQEANS